MNRLFASSSLPTVAALVIGISVIGVSHQALADADAKTTIDSFDGALLDIMKNADKLGYKGRYEKLTPVIERIYDLPLMARISVGPQWSTLTPDQQTKIVEAFKELSIATYASRFDGYGGEKFEITGESPTAGGDDFVDTKMLRPNDDAVDLNYRLRKTGTDWKVIDVFLSGTISQLANYRSEFSLTLRSKGADGLVQLIDDKVAALAPKG
jgi:phospholipid transport system substrate-binding protein